MYIIPLFWVDDSPDPDQTLEATVKAGVVLAEAPLPKYIVVLGIVELAGESTCWYWNAHHALNQGQVFCAPPG